MTEWMPSTGLHGLRNCTHRCRRVCWWAIAQSAAFPIEHFVWEKLWPLRLVTHWMGV